MASKALHQTLQNLVRMRFEPIISTHLLAILHHTLFQHADTTISDMETLYQICVTHPTNGVTCHVNQKTERFISIKFHITVSGIWPAHSVMCHVPAQTIFLQRVSLHQALEHWACTRCHTQISRQGHPMQFDILILRTLRKCQRRRLLSQYALALRFLTPLPTHKSSA